jgi:hypothetical protein
MKFSTLLILTTLASLTSFGLVMGRSNSNAATPKVNPTAPATSAPVQPIAQPTIAPLPSAITVHFPRMPISGYNFEYTYNVTRSTLSAQKDVAALQALFAGPTAAEISSTPGLQRPLPLLAATACAGQTLPSGATNARRFMFRRTITGTDVAYKIRFCVPYASGGIGDDARLSNSIKETLWANIPYVAGVNNISQIEIATSNNFCIGASGNICWP